MEKKEKLEECGWRIKNEPAWKESKPNCLFLNTNNNKYLGFCSEH